MKNLHGDHALTDSDRVRFVAHVKLATPPSSCWLWDCTSNRGRGVFTAGRGRVLASRAAWMIYSGPIPAGMQVLHHCDNPRCVNPKHLFLGSHADNMADKAAKGRAYRPAGERHHMAKLTAKDAAAIYDLVVNCGERSDVVAERFGVGYHTIRKIATGARWAFATGAAQE